MDVSDEFKKTTTNFKILVADYVTRDVNYHLYSTAHNWNV